MTAEQIENLKTLANYLESGKLKADFNMRFFSEASILSGHNCGTVGCAVGHGPYAGIPKYSYESWFHYAQRAFTANEAEHRWCFSGTWANVDNTPQGAAARIKYMLEYGVPDAFKEFVSYCPFNYKRYIGIINEKSK